MCLMMWCKTDCFMSDFKDTWAVTLFLKQTIACRLAWQTDVYRMRPSSVCYIKFKTTRNLPNVYCVPDYRRTLAVKHSWSILFIPVFPAISVGCMEPIFVSSLYNMWPCLKTSSDASFSTCSRWLCTWNIYRMS